MAYKMKGFSGFKNSPAKQEGPIPKKNIKLQKGEMEGTWVYEGDKKFDRKAKAYKFPTTQNKAERIIDYEDRAEFARYDAESSEGKEKKQHLANAKKLQHEADIIRNRKSPGKMYGEKSPAKQIPGDPGDKKIFQMSHARTYDKDQIFTKGARAHAGSDVTSERGKRTTYSRRDHEGRLVPKGGMVKTVQKKKKGAPVGGGWETKRSKTISWKKANRQAKRKAKTHTRMGMSYLK